MALTTLFEMTTQHGYVAQVLHNIFRIEQRQPKHFELEFVAIKPGTDRYLRVFYKPRPSEKPVFTFQIPERAQMESTEMWRRNVEKELVNLWKRHFGKDTPDESSSTTSPPTASSTDAQPASETLSSKPEGEGIASMESALSPQSETSSTPSESSSKLSKPRSRKKGNDSLS